MPTNSTYVATIPIIFFSRLALVTHKVINFSNHKNVFLFYQRLQIETKKNKQLKIFIFVPFYENKLLIIYTTKITTYQKSESKQHHNKTLESQYQLLAGIQHNTQQADMQRHSRRSLCH